MRLHAQWFSEWNYRLLSLFVDPSWHSCWVRPWSSVMSVLESDFVLQIPSFLLSVSLLRFTVLFSHGNAVDLGQMSSFYIGLGTRINCNIFSYDYSGYGVSTGKPSEKNLYADIDAAWQALRSRWDIKSIPGQNQNNCMTVVEFKVYSAASYCMT